MRSVRSVGSYIRDWINDNVNGLTVEDEHVFDILESIANDDNAIETALMDMEAMLHYFDVPETTRKRAVEVLKGVGEKESALLARKMPIKITHDSLIAKEAEIITAFDVLAKNLETFSEYTGVSLPDDFEEMTRPVRTTLREKIAEKEAMKHPRPQLTEVASAVSEVLHLKDSDEKAL